MGLSADRLYKTKGDYRATAAKVAANAKPYQGGMVSVNATGYAKASSATVGERVIGLCASSVDNTGGADGALVVPLLTDLLVKFLNDGTHPLAQADVGHVAWVKDDQTVQGGAGGSSVIAGIVDSLDADGGVWVFVSNDAQHASTVRAAPEVITASGALSTTVLSTVSSAAGVLALTLANGSFEGQQKSVFLKTAGHNAVITPATFADGATITLSAASQFWIGEWHSDGWHNVATSGAIA